METNTQIASHSPAPSSRIKSALECAFQSTFGGRPTILDLLAVAIVLMYAGLCLSTILHAHRTYEELYAFESDGPAYLILLDHLAHGRVYRVFIYGYFPILTAYIFSLPFLLVGYILSDSNHVAALILGFRLSQIFFCTLAAWLVYRITTVLSSRLLGIICLLFFLSMHEVFRWTTFLHPDIQQLAMTLAGCYFLIKYCETGQTRDFLISAVFAGLATACKFFGVFLIPVAAIAAFATGSTQASSLKAKLYQTTKSVAVYGLVHTVAFLVVSPPFLLRFIGNIRLLGSFSDDNNTISWRNAFSSDLWQRKGILLFDETFLGTTACIAFVVAVVYLIACSIARKTFDRVLILIGFVFSFLTFLIMWGDVFNLQGGYRYLFQGAALVPIVIAVAVYDAGGRFGKAGRAAAIVVALIVLMFPSKTFLQSRFASMSREVTMMWTREKSGQFQIGQWLEKNVPAGSIILIQSYLNIVFPAHLPWSTFDNGDRWRGKNDIRVFFNPVNNVFLTPEAVLKFKPDYVIGINKKELDVILADIPAYRLIATVGEPIGHRGVVYVLGK